MVRRIDGEVLEHVRERAVMNTWVTLPVERSSSHCPPSLGCACVTHIAQALTGQDAHTTDRRFRSHFQRSDVARNFGCERWRSCSLQLGSSTTLWWDNDEGETHEVTQGEGGKQGDPSMSALYAFGKRRVLVAAIERSLPHRASVDSALQICTSFSSRPSGNSRDSWSTMGRPRFGTEVARLQEVGEL